MQSTTIFRFLAYVNQSDWRAKRLLNMVENLQDEIFIRAIVKSAEQDFTKTNKQRLKKDRLPIPIEELQALQSVLRVAPLHVGIVDALENWIIESRKDSARAP